MEASILEPRSAVIQLSSGRLLSYAEWGRSGGRPVIHMHGMPGSRIERQAEPELYGRLGIRMITPDRPGYGNSDVHSGTLLDWAADVEELADRLELPSFGITALSGGGIYALACAARFPERLTGVVVTGCPSPLVGPHALRKMSYLNRLGIRVTQRAPIVLELGATLLSGVLRRYPQFFLSQINRDKVRPDRELLASPAVRTAVVATLREAISHGTWGYVDDIRLLGAPWGFDPASIQVPVQFWHGDIDSVIPVHHAFLLAERIPHSTLHLVPGEGHMLLWSHLEEVLTEAIGGIAAPVAARVA
ncbi:MAG TPA: alpha/beta hydrolase [Candidatus Dormibacteraeota bacterium]|nr:alpha/beta hydrolase [Candidatus Dormibacteraeota bacterium]